MSTMGGSSRVKLLPGACGGYLRGAQRGRRAWDLWDLWDLGDRWDGRVANQHLITRG